MDGEFLAGSRINLGFGKSLATTCVWIDGVAESVSEKYLASHFNQFGSVTHCVIDRTREHALVFFQQVNVNFNFNMNILLLFIHWIYTLPNCYQMHMGVDYKLYTMELMVPGLKLVLY